jgi:hypothetical protein
MYKNSEIEETGVAAGVLGHPAMGVAWLANKLGSLGTPLEAGHLVLAGSFTAWCGRRRATPSAPTSASSGVFPCSSSNSDPHGEEPPEAASRTMAPRYAGALGHPSRLAALAPQDEEWRIYAALVACSSSSMSRA